MFVNNVLNIRTSISKTKIIQNVNIISSMSTSLYLTDARALKITLDILRKIHSNSIMGIGMLGW